ncbi:MAG: hypothetical protein E7523_05930 [Ruminococcaceae bacterium]|nr:hypothetical protein [Oscillospiraceae bacterium]
MKIKRFCSLFLAITLVLCAGCNAPRRFGMQELSRRLEQQNERYAFSLDGVTLYNGYYQIPFSLMQEEDLLLSCKEDEKGQLTQILLTAEQETAPTDDFLAFTQLLIASFCGVSEYEAAAMAEEAGLTGADVLFSDHTGTATKGRYSFTFFSTPLSITGILTYDDAVVAKQ